MGEVSIKANPSYMDRERNRRSLFPVSLGVFQQGWYIYYRDSPGVVSTYSLVNTTSYAYYGGVLASNGDIHFFPLSANCGQKISPEGIVSTYSLVYTADFAYYGGVLASNGDIHFIPLSANCGQKIIF
jgi:hypothetical protein